MHFLSTYFHCFAFYRRDKVYNRLYLYLYGSTDFDCEPGCPTKNVPNWAPNLLRSVLGMAQWLQRNLETNMLAAEAPSLLLNWLTLAITCLTRTMEI